MPPRQARLRSTCSDGYAGITPGAWHHALWVREKALANLRHREPRPESGEQGRILSDAHFEFQGGTTGGRACGVERRMIRQADSRGGVTDPSH